MSPHGSNKKFKSLKSLLLSSREESKAMYYGTEIQSGTLLTTNHNSRLTRIMKRYKSGAVNTNHHFASKLGKL